ncbi:hypothetical protein Q5P01_014100 [Channa striata]|uniref:Uncharacterized protein n=1 Tax=Channa striata TaxID=64152 RepID=A0AA88SP72_CHASR|nr:hypothetical protein Q5P01_014100 [Channa striata]
MEPEEIIRALREEISRLRVELKYERVRANHRDRDLQSEIHLLQKQVECQADLTENYKNLYVAAQTGFEGLVKRLRQRLSQDSHTGEGRDQPDAEPDDDPDMVNVVTAMEGLWVQWRHHEDPPEDETARVRQEVFFHKLTEQPDTETTQNDEEGETVRAPRPETHVDAASPGPQCEDAGVACVSGCLDESDDEGLFSPTFHPVAASVGVRMETSNMDSLSQEVDQENLRDESLTFASVNKQQDMWTNETVYLVAAIDHLSQEVVAEAKDRKEESLTLASVNEQLDTGEPETAAAEPPQQEAESPSGWFSSKLVTGACAGAAAVAGVGAVAVALYYLC